MTTSISVRVVGGGDAEVSRTKNLQLLELPAGNADVSRYSNYQCFEMPAGNADVSRYRNYQCFELPAGNADVSRYRNLAFFDMDERDEVKLKVSVWGPGRVSPGQTIDYLIEYRNDGLKAAENVPLVFRLPSEAEYVSTIGDGTYRKSFHEVSWFLGKIPPKTVGYLTVRARIAWGLPQSTYLASSVYVPKEREFDIAPVLNMTFDVVDVKNGYVKTAVSVPGLGSNCTILLEITFQEIPDETKPYSTFNETNDGAKIENVFAVKGSWIESKINDGAKIENMRAVKESSSPALNWIKVLANIIILGTGYVPGLVAKTIYDVAIEPIFGIYLANYRNNLRLQTLESARHLLSESDYDFLLNKSYKLANAEGSAILLKLALSFVGELIEDNDAMKGLLYKYIWNLKSINPETGENQLETSIEQLLESNDGQFREEFIKKVAADGKIRIQELYDNAQIESGWAAAINSFGSTIQMARDPNAKYGLGRYVLAGQTLNYTIAYQNEGEGAAFGVYITDNLSPYLDATTLLISDNGTYDYWTRTLTWMIGQVDPQENGTVTFSVNVNDDAPIGTEIINFATVYFPSVPETTNTNGVVNVVSCEHDVAILNVDVSETMPNYVVPIDVMVENQGISNEMLNVTVYANTTIIHGETIALAAGDLTDITFEWNTTGLAPGDYAISAVVEPVLGETDAGDNSSTDGTIQVIPEFPPFIILPLFMIATLLAVKAYRRKRAISGQKIVHQIF